MTAGVEANAVGESGTTGKAIAPFRQFLSDFAESRFAVAALAILMLVVFMAVFAPVVTPQNPYDLKQLDVTDSKLAPGETSMPITGSISNLRAAAAAETAMSAKVSASGEMFKVVSANNRVRSRSRTRCIPQAR